MAATVKARDRSFIMVWLGSSMHYLLFDDVARITWSGGPNLAPITFTMRGWHTQRVISPTEGRVPNADRKR